MMQVVRRTLLLVTLTLAVATPVAVAASETANVNVPAAGLTLVIPPSWKVVSAKTVTSAAAQGLAEENPQLAAIFAELSRPGTGVAFFAFDPLAAATFATNVNIVTSALPAGVTIAQYRAAAARELRLLPGRVGTTSSTIVRLPAGQAVQSTVDVEITAHGAKLVARVNQWAFLRPRKSVVVSFTTRVSTYGRYKAAFSQIVRSVRFR